MRAARAYATQPHDPAHVLLVWSLAMPIQIALTYGQTLVFVIRIEL